MAIKANVPNRNMLNKAPRNSLVNSIIICINSFIVIGLVNFRNSIWNIIVS